MGTDAKRFTRFTFGFNSIYNGVSVDQIGLVNRVVADDKLQAEAFALAKSLAEGPRVALRNMKDNLDDALHIDYPTALFREAERLVQASRTEDHKEAVRAFVEKRKPVFVGK